MTYDLDAIEKLANENLVLDADGYDGLVGIPCSDVLALCADIRQMKTTIEELDDHSSKLDEENEKLNARLGRMREGLEIISGKRQCLDNLMGNVDIARAALKDTALHSRSKESDDTG